MADPYDVLGLKRGATYEEVKAAYRRLAKQYHSDTGGTDEAFIRLNTAYRYILNEIQ